MLKLHKRGSRLELKEALVLIIYKIYKRHQYLLSFIKLNCICIEVNVTSTQYWQSRAQNDCGQCSCRALFIPKWQYQLGYYLYTLRRFSLCLVGLIIPVYSNNPKHIDRLIGSFLFLLHACDHGMNIKSGSIAKCSFSELTHHLGQYLLENF